MSELRARLSRLRSGIRRYLKNLQRLIDRYRSQL
jgi:hypothetical protein